MNTGTVIVTGGCGYLGSHTIIELINNDYNVVSIDNFSRSSPRALENILNVTGKRVKNFEIDLCDKRSVNLLFSELKGAWGLIHFAAFKSVPESVTSPGLYYQNNLVSLINVLNASKKNGIQSIVFSSSCSVYGDVSNLPVSEQTPLSAPKSAYAATKVFGESIVTDVCRTSQIGATCLRYFNPVGAHPSGLNGEMPFKEPDNLVPLITQTASGIREKMTVFGGSLKTRDGSCIRDYVHVMDIANAHVLALKYLSVNHDVREVINLGTGLGVSVFEAIRAFEEVSLVKLNYDVGPQRLGDVIEIYSNAVKAWNLLGWRAKYSIQDMMESAWKWELTMSKFR